MNCSNGHEIKGTEKYCARCGESLLRCQQGHRLEGGEDYCPECGVPVSITKTTAHSMGTAPDLSPTDTREESGTASPRAFQPTRVVCGRCHFEEVVDGANTEWTCGRCNTVWYVVTCGTCGEVQITSEHSSRQRCLDCKKVLAKSNPYIGDETLGEVEPQLANFLADRYLAGVLEGPGGQASAVSAPTLHAGVSSRASTSHTSEVQRPHGRPRQAAQLRMWEQFWYVGQCVAFGAGYFAKIPARKALSEVGLAEMKPAENFWYVMECIAFGAGYFTKIPIKKALTRLSSEVAHWQDQTADIVSMGRPVAESDWTTAQVIGVGFVAFLVIIVAFVLLRHFI